MFLPSWNEFGVIAQANPWSLLNPFVRAMGAKAFDERRNSFFVDGYGESKSRTIEPSTEDQGTVMEVLGSCMRVARLAELGGEVAEAVLARRSTGNKPGNSGGGDHLPPGQVIGCSVSGGLCCEHGVLERLTNMWSMQKWIGTGGKPNATNGVLTGAALSVSVADAASINASAGWTEVCAAYGKYRAFCSDERYLQQEPFDLVKRGPFLLLPNSTDISRVPFPVQALVRCKPVAAALNADSGSIGAHGEVAGGGGSSSCLGGGEGDGLLPANGFSFGARGASDERGCGTGM